MIRAFPYPGSKCKAVSKLLSIYPEHKIYVSLFGGSGVDILYKDPSKVEVFNDVDQHVITFFRVLQTDYMRDELKRRLAETAYSRREFEIAINSLQSQRLLRRLRRSRPKKTMQPLYKRLNDTLTVEYDFDPVSRALHWMIGTWQGRQSHCPLTVAAASWGNGAATHNPVQKWQMLDTCIDATASRFRRIYLDCRDWSKVLPEHDSPDTFYFVDPPYMLSTIARKDQYAHVLSDDDHFMLLDALNAIQGKAIIFGNRSPVYDEMLAHWIRIKTFREFAWVNFEVPRLDLASGS